jgi:hypothetical protein
VALLQPPVLTPTRIRLAYAVAVASDAIQLFIGPVGWAFTDEAVDVAAMVLTSAMLGFHPLLLPTFALEFLPIVDLLPTWTGCVALVVAMRKKQQAATAHTPAPDAVVIDVVPDKPHADR